MKSLLSLKDVLGPVLFSPKLHLNEASVGPMWFL